LLSTPRDLLKRKVSDAVLLRCQKSSPEIAASTPQLSSQQTRRIDRFDDKGRWMNRHISLTGGVRGQKPKPPAPRSDKEGSAADGITGHRSSAFD